jgi:hypothetical protein
MRVPRLTIGRLMIALAMLTALGFATWVLSGARAIRRGYLYQAAENRMREGWLRVAAARFEGCPPGHARVDRDAATCPRCRSAWDKSLLNHTVRTPAEAVEALDSSADLLGGWAGRFERGAARPWAELPVPTATEYAPIAKLKNGDGPINKGFFDAY